MPKKEKEIVETTGAKPQEDWIARRWRPMMGWMYMLVCSFDFMIAPVLWALLLVKTGNPVKQWEPLTLQGAGLFHMAMGAVLGVAAYGRTQEKLGGANNGGIQLPSSSPSPTPSPAPVVTNSWGSQPLGSGSGFGSAPSTGFGSSPSVGSTSSDVTVGFGGKKAPPAVTDYPER